MTRELRDRRWVIAAVVGVVLTLAAGISDFVTGSFWEHHGLFASLVASLLVVVITVVVVNEVIERRERRRWSLLAQSVLFALIQSARATWTGMVEVLELGEVESGAIEPLLSAAGIARDTSRVSAAIAELLGDPKRRARLQRVVAGLSSHAADVIAKWAPVMVGAGPYAEVLDRHVELSGRLEWLSSVLAYLEPLEGQSLRDRALIRSNIASEHAVELGNDEWLHDQILAVIMLATELDYRSREQAYELVPLTWWSERTAGLTGNESPPPPLSS